MPRNPIQEVITVPELVNGPLGELTAIVNRFVIMRDGVLGQFAEVNETYRMSKTDRDPNRWKWLTAARAAIDTVDRAAPDAAAMEAEFRAKYAATPIPFKKVLEYWGPKMGRYYEHRLKCRESWYYTATGHRWGWEREKPGLPLNDRLMDKACKRFGCQRDQVLRFVAWVDLLATDLLPGSLRQLLTIPLAFMS